MEFGIEVKAPKKAKPRGDIISSNQKRAAGEPAVVPSSKRRRKRASAGSLSME
jgi:hypothetical protein